MRRTRHTAVFVLSLFLSAASPAFALILYADRADATLPTVVARTFILRPDAQKGTVRVEAFFALRAERDLPSGAVAQLVLPVQGDPSDVRAQAMTLQGFDRSYTHAADLEPAFYERSRFERQGKAAVVAAVGAVGGAPAWLAMALSLPGRRAGLWPPKGPPITAVLPPTTDAAQALPAIRGVRVAPLHEWVGRLAAAPHAAALAALRDYTGGRCIVVSLTSLPPGGDGAFAVAGIRVTYEVKGAFPPGAGPALVPLFTSPEATPALTRVYAATPWNVRAALSAPGLVRGGSPAQALVNRAVAGIGAPGANLARTRTANGGETIRAVWAFSEPGASVRVHFSRSPAGAWSVTQLALGAALCGLLWPACAALYLATLIAAARAYRWMTLLPPPPSFARRFALLAALSPWLTLWFVLRYLRPPGRLPPDGDTSGALGALPPESYECVARLVLWALAVCADWAVLRSFVGLAGALRFGWTS